MSRMGPRAVRAGFTLIELLIVIAIIGILASLLLAGIIYAMRGKDDVSNVNEINQLKIACEKFKEVFTVYPPGIIKLCSRRSDYDPPKGMSNDPLSLDYYSVTMLNRMFPKIGNFGGGGPKDPPAIAWDGVNVLPATNPASYILLYGDQSLVYFLGGVPKAGTPGLGFSVDPQAPTSNTPSRKGPYFPGFNPTRITATVLINGVPTPIHSTSNAISQAFPSYLDAYSTSQSGNPILYFSGVMRNTKNGYFDPFKVPAGFPGAQKDPTTGNIYVTQAIPGLQSNFGIAYTQSALGVQFLGINPFQTSNNGIFPFYSTPTLAAAAQPFTASFVCPSPDTFQIVTGGRDQVFGPGGLWQPTTAPSYDTPGQFDPPHGNGQDDFTSFSDRKLGAGQ